MPSSIKILGARELVAALRKVRDEVAKDMRGVVVTEAAAILAQSAVLVPRDTGALAASAFVDGAQVNKEKHSVSATCGYEHPQAGAIHEGFHWGKKVKEPPHFLRKPVKARKSAFRKIVAVHLFDSIKRHTK